MSGYCLDCGNTFCICSDIESENLKNNMDGNVKEAFNDYLISHDQGILAHAGETEIDVAERAFEKAWEIQNENINEIKRELEQVIEILLKWKNIADDYLCDAEAGNLWDKYQNDCVNVQNVEAYYKYMENRK